ncbi:MAG: hypothetical protein VB055_01335 [Oscillospiraceae bacterium]|nr:hypothetical protein [Oscillospiraceae bacterium]
MEKELERYRKSIRNQNFVFAGAAVILIVFIVLSLLEVFQPAYRNERWADGWNGFICGASSSVVALMLFGIIQNLRAMRRPDVLRKQYVREHDERTREICYRSGHSSYWFDSLGLLLGVVIGGYFHPVVSLSCLGCLLYICLVRAALKIYYYKKL